jgi:cation diffusion facilitator CzcD-associated flavoprotein CzcO
MDDFQGRIVHPQTWPNDLDLSGKRVVVIGSGATAATLIPAIAGQCAHVTMLQRSPTFFITGRNANDLADTLRQLDIPSRLDARDRAPQGAVRPGQLHPPLPDEPEVVRQELLAGVRAALGPGHEDAVEQHFTRATAPGSSASPSCPTPTCSRPCASGQASVVTDQIECFTPTACSCSRARTWRPTSSSPPPASTSTCWATSRFTIDGAPLDFAQTVAGAAACSPACPTWPGSSATSARAGRCAPT